MNINKIKRLAFVLLLWPIYFISKLFPRSKKIWVYGSITNTFADNSKYLFIKQHYLNDGYKIKPVWITKSKKIAEEMTERGYKSYTKTSLKGIYYCLRASVYVYSWTIRDINFWLSGGASLISLWHGIPFKEVGTDNEQRKKPVKKTLRNLAGRLFQSFLYPSQHLKSDILLSTRSSEVSEIFKRTFSTRYIFQSIYPRTEHFLMKREEKESFIKNIATEEEKNLLNNFERFDSIWIYMPTFRDKTNDEKLYGQDVFDFDLINPILQKKNILLLVKYHYVAMQRISDKDKYSNIIFLNSKMDVYILLPYTSGLITDYSSVFFDYMLLQKPIIFYAFDLESYRKNHRAFYYPYEEATCGSKIYNFKELCNWFKDDNKKNVSFDYEPYIKRFWGSVEKPYLLDQLYELAHKN